MLARPLYLASAVILLVGGVAAALVFVTAAPNLDEDVVGYRMVDGHTYPVTLEQSARDMQILRAEGGRANVAAAELDAWAGSLWRGRRLSYTLAAISAVLAGLCAGIARSIKASQSAPDAVPIASLLNVQPSAERRSGR